MGKRIMKLSFGNKKSYIYLDYQEYVTMNTIIKAIRIINAQGYKKFSSSRLITVAFKYRSKEFVTSNRIRRMIAFLIAARYITVTQKGNLRLISIGDSLRNILEEKTKSSNIETKKDLVSNT